MKKFIITEEERENILNRHKDATKNHYLISEALGGQDSSSEERMKQKYPNGFDLPYTVTSYGNSTFSNGVDIINKNDPKIKEILLTISDLLKVTKGDVKVIVNGSASAVGGSSGYNNKSLATRRRDNLIKLIKDNTQSLRLIVTPGATVVGKSTVKDSAASTKEQYVSASISGQKIMNVPIKAEKGDNTNTYIPKIEKIVDKKLIKKKRKIKRVCVQIPEQYLDKFKQKVREFKRENSLGDIPYGVYDVK
jgi:hypothetical protein